MASARQSFNPHGEEQTTALIFLVFLGALLFLWIYFAATVYLTCSALHFLWGIVDFPPFRTIAAPKYNLLANTGNNSGAVSVSQWLDVMEQTVGILYIFLIPTCIATLFAWWQHPSQAKFSRREINIETLPHIAAAYSPPMDELITNSYGKRLLLDARKEDRRLSMTPEDFAQKYELIHLRELNEPKAAALFMLQLGPELSSWKSIRGAHKALFTVFGLQFFLNDRKAAEKLLDDLNRSCRISSKRDRGKFTTPLWSIAASHFSRVTKHPEAKKWLSGHRYVRTGIVWLYAHDLRLPPPRWRWLKGVDRTLYYALHRANAAKGFIEGAGVVSVSRNEGTARALGLPIPEASVTTAVEGLKNDLVSIGLLWEPDEEKDALPFTDITWRPENI